MIPHHPILPKLPILPILIAAATLNLAPCTLVAAGQDAPSPETTAPLAAFTFTATAITARTASTASTASETSQVRIAPVRLRSGVTLQVAQSGPADGEPVLFLHGFTDSWLSYSRVLHGLPAHLRAIVPTQRGHGDSERPDCCYRHADFVSDAMALLDALGLARATIVGHSMGSFIAQRIAIEHPARVNRLVLIGSGATVRTPAVLDFDRTVRTLADPVAPAFVREFQHSTLARPVPAAFFDAIVHESGKVPARVWRDTLAGLIAADAPPDLSRIAASTLIVWGDKDTLWSQAEQDGLLRAIRGARLLMYAGTGHSPHWEEPERFLADLASFLAEPAAPPTPAATEAPAAAAAHRTRDGHAHAVHATRTTPAATHAAHAQAPHEAAHAPAAPASHKRADAMPAALLPGLGDWHFKITTTSPDAQRYFDQGFRLTYGFNHEEALRSFERATQLDPQCAMCYWGIAYAVGPNINLPMDAKAEARALEAIGTAARWSGRASASERALIEAMTARFGEPAGSARPERDAAYAAAMRRVAQRFPHDVDIQTLFADAMLNVRPWNQWTPDGQPQPGTEELVAALEGALAREPNHAGACHFYIHAVEASRTPERALPCAERLPRLMPGAGHVVHMPAHVYLRVGRYAEAASANIAAVEADNRYFAAREVKGGFYPMFYGPHNLHFLWATYMLSGQRAKATDAARALVERVAIDDARANVPLQGFLPATILTHARFAAWNAVLAEPAPPADLQYVTGMWHYARGLALAARGDARAAGDELHRVRTIAGQVKEDQIIILNPAPVLLKLAAEALSGHIALAQKRADDAVAHFRAAAQIEDTLTYDEPPPWYHSVRNMLGEGLMAAGRPTLAEEAFREDLLRVRETGWSLSGLERALRAQGKTREAGDVAQRFTHAWRYADVPAPAGVEYAAGSR